jgi:hypothetical protein
MSSARTRPSSWLRSEASRSDLASRAAHRGCNRVQRFEAGTHTEGARALSIGGLPALSRCNARVRRARRRALGGPGVSGKRIVVRGSLVLKARTCTRISAPDPLAECAWVRSSHLANVYVGPIQVALSYACKCFIDGGHLCPVSAPGQPAVVNGKYEYSSGPHIGSPEDAPPTHMLKDVSICVE